MKCSTTLHFLAVIACYYRVILFGTSGILLGLLPAATILWHSKNFAPHLTLDPSLHLYFKHPEERSVVAISSPSCRQFEEETKSENNNRFKIFAAAGDGCSGNEETEDDDVVQTSLTEGYMAISGRNVKGIKGCRRTTGVTCRLFTCNNWLGATECLNGECVCRPGYCSDKFGVCRGCSHFTAEVHQMPAQHTKAGYYSAVSGFFEDGRPVWKQFHGENWIWYCRSHSCWIISDVPPNDEGDCSSGIVSPRSTRTATPFDLSEKGWKCWDGFSWVDNLDHNNADNDGGSSHRLECGKPHLRLRCQDFRFTGASDEKFFSARNSVTQSL